VWTVGSCFRRRYYRDASSILAFLGAAAAATSAAFAYHHGWAWLNNNTDGSTLEPLNWALAPFASAVVALRARHIAPVG
jgi:hypothetical protein